MSGLTEAGVISRQIDDLRGLVTNSAFLQVTATPYALYLQPDDEAIVNGISMFKPKRPAFTVLLPIHSKYTGGDEYFEKSTEPDSPGFYFYREVPIAERDALKHEDRRRLQIDRVLTENCLCPQRCCCCLPSGRGHTASATARSPPNSPEIQFSFSH